MREKDIIINQCIKVINEYLKGERQLAVCCKGVGIAVSTFEHYVSNNFGNVGTKYQLAKQTLRERSENSLKWNIQRLVNTGFSQETIIQSKFVRKLNPNTNEFEIIAKPLRKYEKVRQLPLRDLLETIDKHYPHLKAKQIELDEKPIFQLTSGELQSKINAIDELDNDETMPDE